MTDAESAKTPGDENAGWRKAAQELTTSAMEVAAIAEELERNRKENLAIRREHLMVTLVGACLQDAEFSFEDALHVVPHARKVADAIMEAAK